jgi:hypothetical protein
MSGSSLPAPTTAWFSSSNAPSKVYLPLVRVTGASGGGVESVEQVENKNRQFGRSVHYMSCTETKYSMGWS